METYRFQPGETPVLVSIPHVGTAVPLETVGNLTDAALSLPDTDWDVDRLFHFAPALGIGFLKATVSRHVVDINRDPDDLEGPPVCPLYTFEEEPIHKPGCEPDGAEIARRVDEYWRPYHACLDTALQELLDTYGVAVLLDLHSIRTAASVFDEEPIADISLGSWDGITADPGLVDRIATALEAVRTQDVDVDGPFKGGFVIKRHGCPKKGVHAIFVELCQSLYMDEGPERRFRDDLAAGLRPPLERMLGVAIEWAWAHSNRPYRVTL